MIRKKGYAVGNVDAVVVAEHPKINPHIPSMQKVIAEVLEVELEQISIKASTNEQLGLAGGRALWHSPQHSCTKSSPSLQTFVL